MPVEQLKMILVLLKELATKELVAPQSNVGICGYVDVELFRRHGEIVGCGWMREITKTWPHFSGDRIYPVPDPEGLMSGYIIYHSTKNMWVDAYGELRKDLVKHLIKEISAAVKKVEIPNPTI